VGRTADQAQNLHGPAASYINGLPPPSTHMHARAPVLLHTPDVDAMGLADLHQLQDGLAQAIALSAQVVVEDAWRACACVQARSRQEMCAAERLVCLGRAQAHARMRHDPGILDMDAAPLSQRGWVPSLKPGLGHGITIAHL